MLEFQKILTYAKEAIAHVDDVMARKLLKEIELVLSRGKNQIDPTLLAQLRDIQLKLKIVNFPNLSEEEACNILRNHYLESFSIGISMENRLTAMLFFYPEIPRDDLRKKLKAALMQNQQPIGKTAIGFWIQEFEKMFPVVTRDLNASVRFSIEHPQARLLTAIDRENLKDLLHAYDYLLVTTLPATGPILDQILKAMPLENVQSSSSDLRFGQQNFSSSVVPQKQYNQSQSSGKTIQETLSKALQIYPRLGEQSITNNQIKLRLFQNPVRPSIKNWISDFHDAMGSGKHTPIDRGNYLFHSENGKTLSPVDRQKVGMILKSLDEQTLLTIDPVSEIVIFDGDENVQSDSEPKIEKNRHSYISHNVNESQFQENKKVGTSVDLSQSKISNSFEGMRVAEKKAETVSYLKDGRDNTEYSQKESSIEKFYGKGSSLTASNPNEEKKSVVNLRETILPAGLIKQPDSFKIEKRPDISQQERKEEYFSIPSSKPPIGSDNFNTVQEKIHSVKNQISMSVENLATNNLQQKVSKFETQNIANSNDNGRDAMSDEMLLRLYQDEQKKKSNSNEASSKVIFSSPQKLPIEKLVNEKVVSTEKQKPGINGQDEKILHSYHISSGTNIDNKLPKVKGNIVDLKN